MLFKLQINKKLVLSFALILTSFLSFSQDRLFTYAYQSGVLNSGQKEIEVWNTFHNGREDYYKKLKHRTEFEFGLGKNLQTSLYLNITGKTFTENTNNIKSLATEMEFGFSNEWKYKILDPVANAVGLALYGEYSYATNEQELEAKLIIDKKSDKMTYALNLVGEVEWVAKYENNDIEWEKEKVAEINLAMAYTVNQNLHLTFEALNANGFEEKGDLNHSVLYAGLGFSYVNNNIWVNFTLMPQVYAFKGATNGSLNLNDHEKLQTRVVLSYAF